MSRDTYLFWGGTVDPKATVCVSLSGNAVRGGAGRRQKVQQEDVLTLKDVENFRKINTQPEPGGEVPQIN